MQRSQALAITPGVYLLICRIMGLSIFSAFAVVCTILVYAEPARIVPYIFVPSSWSADWEVGIRRTEIESCSLSTGAPAGTASSVLPVGTENDHSPVLGSVCGFFRLHQSRDPEIAHFNSWHCRPGLLHVVSMEAVYFSITCSIANIHLPLSPSSEEKFLYYVYI